MNLLKLIIGLDAFGCHRRAELRRDANDGSNDGRSAGIADLSSDIRN